jgi:hypothetical protein
MGQIPAEWTVALVTAIVTCAWVVPPVVVARIGGWHRLAAVYPCDRIVEGTRWRWQSATFRRGMAYNHGLTFTATEEGLALSMIFFWRIGHPPLFFPWGDISARRQRGFLGIEYVTLSFAGEPAVPLHLSARLVEKIRGAVGTRWTETPPEG